MVQEQGGYTPIGCPIYGKTDCYDIIDAETGTVIIAKAKGKMPWIPQCGQWGYANPGETGNCPDGQGLINGQCGKAAIACPNGDGTVTLLEITQDSQNNVTGLTGKSFGVVTEEQAALNNRVLGKYSFDAAVWCKTKEPAAKTCPGVQEMSFQSWQEHVLQQKLDWEAAGKKTTVGDPIKWTAPDGKQTTSQYCYWPDGTSGEVATNLKDGCPMSCQEIYDLKHAPAQQPASQPAPSGEGSVPISIDIQAFTPGGTGPIPTQPLPPQQRPTQVPMKQEPAPAKAQWVAPKPVEEKTLDTGSAVGIGAVLIAAAAAAFFGGK